ncbi:hypothetical protein D9758_016277 [Tetrapyrgos nigripes]|uniref:Uncharacterized protein n=1 Tax=Tetrapyrgos nigripes TaxID=182062 RepID=A0A8H5C885_9AGAR|nr:hypothetical protein D9758_016277 [Tetrapyrgos nigripes]
MAVYTPPDLCACLPNSTLNHGADANTAEDIEKDMTDRTGPSIIPSGLKWCTSSTSVVPSLPITIISPSLLLLSLSSFPSAAPVKLDSGTEIDSSIGLQCSPSSLFLSSQLSLSLILFSLSLLLQWEIFLGVHAQASQAPPMTFGSATNRLGFCMGFERHFWVCYRDESQFGLCEYDEHGESTDSSERVFTIACDEFSLSLLGWMS